jgi:hypothetical protein
MSFCWKQAIDRGVGTIPNYCNTRENMDGLCYNRCKNGYTGIGPICWENCQHGYHDDGLFCRQPIPLHIYTKKSYGRGIGTIPKCSPNLTYDTGLCYKSCNKTYEGIGPLCWQKCSGQLAISCGAGCTNSHTTCMNTIMSHLKSIPKIISRIPSSSDIFSKIERLNMPIC